MVIPLFRTSISTSHLMGPNSSTQKNQEEHQRWRQSLFLRRFIIPVLIIRFSSAIFLASRGRSAVSSLSRLISFTPRLWILKVLLVSEDIWLIENIPVMPPFDLLFMKMQGWRDQGALSRQDFRTKVKADVVGKVAGIHACCTTVADDLVSIVVTIEDTTQTCSLVRRGMRRGNKVSELRVSRVSCA